MITDVDGLLLSQHGPFDMDTCDNIIHELQAKSAELLKSQLSSSVTEDQKQPIVVSTDVHMADSTIVRLVFQTLASGQQHFILALAGLEEDEHENELDREMAANNNEMDERSSIH